MAQRFEAVYEDGSRHEFTKLTIDEVFALRNAPEDENAASLGLRSLYTAAKRCKLPFTDAGEDNWYLHLDEIPSNLEDDEAGEDETAPHQSSPASPSALDSQQTDSAGFSE